MKHPNLTKYIILIIFVVTYTISSAQKYTISGYIEDSKTGEKLINANIYETKTYIGTVSNNYGFYSITFSKAKINLTFSYVGYQAQQFNIELTKDTLINISLIPNIEIKEIIVTDKKSEKKIKSTQMSLIEIPVRQIKSLPVLLGETDILKTIQLMPGVQSGSEGSSGIYVRGGGPDQNLFLLDGVPIYNVSHLFGFLSVFNDDAIKNVSLIKGGFPARYGGRLSSVVDIRMKEGNNREFKGAGSVGIISSKLTLEGPIIKNKTSFIVSGRRTYIDILAYPFIKYFGDGETFGYYFYDLNGKINHKFSDKSRLYISSYMGNDKIHFKYNYDYSNDNIKYENEEKFSLEWGNIINAIRWNYLINNKLFSNTTITYSRFRFLTGSEFTDIVTEPNKKPKETVESMKFYSGINDIAGGIDFDYFPTTNQNIKFGFKNMYHTFNPGIFDYNTTSGDTSDFDISLGSRRVYGNESYVYIEDDIKLNDWIKTNIGFHYSNFYVKEKFYNSFQPRFSCRFLINDNLSVKTSYSQMVQYIILLTTTTIGLPNDLWVPVTDKIKPQKSIQYAIGSSYRITEKIDLSIEGYYKIMNNLIEYKEGSTYYGTKKDWQEKVEIGKGWSYGLELFVEKSVGKLSGWLGYTLSWTYRQFDNISYGKKFPYRYDRRHDIGLVVSYKFNDNTDIGATWVYGTGNAITLSFEKYNSMYYSNDYMLEEYSNDNNHSQIGYVENRNNYRMANYHRLDIGANFHKQKKWGKRTWSIGLYNTYNRKNPFFLYFRNEYNYEKDIVQKKLYQFSLFPVIPSVRYSFEF
ncbi:MAG: TonB-dependent receptor [Bacteroidales bacterium]|nr:TonB-dependent receptor [Bacteroidales bacterium]